MTRKPLLVAAVIVAVIALLVWGTAGRVSASTVQPDQVALSLIPAQAATIFGLDMDTLRSSLIYNTWKQKTLEKRNSAEYTEFVTRAGFDPERDLSSVTGAVWQDAAGQPVFVAVVTMNYNRTTLATLLREKNAVVSNYKGFEVFSPPQSRRTPPALALLDDRTMVVGSAAAVQQAIDLKTQPGPNVLSNADLINRVTRIGVENQVWAVSTAPGTFIPRNLPATPGNIPSAIRVLQGLQGSTFAVNASSGLKLLVEGTTGTEEDARTLADAARGLLAMGRLAAPSNRPEALEVLSAFRVEQDQREVRISAQVTPELLNRLFENHAGLIPR